jgi:hypothetical protein
MLREVAKLANVRRKSYLARISLTAFAVAARASARDHPCSLNRSVVRLCSSFSQSRGILFDGISNNIFAEDEANEDDVVGPRQLGNGPLPN